MFKEIFEEIGNLISNKMIDIEHNLRIEYVRRGMFGNKSTYMAEQLIKASIENKHSLYQVIFCHNIIYYMKDKYLIDINDIRLLKILKIMLLISTLYSTNVEIATVTVLNGLYDFIKIGEDEIDYVANVTKKLMGVGIDEG